MRSVLGWPMRMFWSSVRHVDRLRAESDLRSLNLQVTSASAVHSGDAEIINNFRENMSEVLETPMKFEEVSSSKDDIRKLAALKG